VSGTYADGPNADGTHASETNATRPSVTGNTAPGRCAELIAVRHGESTANAAFASVPPGDISGPDADIPLTALGERQSAALGETLAGWPPDRRPEVVLSSPYVRARRTYDIAVEAARERDVTLPAALIDDRLSDRNMGELELMPFSQAASAIAATHPVEPDRLDSEGVYYYRPPAGESLSDVADRTLSLLGDVNRRYDGERVLIVAHDAIVAVLHYLIDRPSLVDFAAHLGENPAANGSITRWVGTDGKLRMTEYNVVDHVPVA
jgi:2,3-bisphosphoglycerate-dependent phosphoglycerate mutase